MINIHNNFAIIIGFIFSVYLMVVMFDNRQDCYLILMSPHSNNALKAFWFVDTCMFRGQNILTGTFRLEKKILKPAYDI